MKPRSPPKRPAPHAVGAARLRVIRGPRADGRWYWRAELYREGASETLWVGWATSAEADQAVIERLAGVTRTTSSDCRTIADLMAYWHGHCEERGDLSPVTIDGYGHLARQVVDGLGPLACDRLDRVALERYRDRRMREGRAARSVEADLKILRLAWRWGRELALVPDRDLPRVRVAVEPLRRLRPTDGEVEAVLGQLQGASRLHLLLLWSTGCRIGEVGGLRWGDVFERDGVTWIRVVGKRRMREVPLPPRAAAELRAWAVGRQRDAETMILGRNQASAKTMLHTHLTRLGVAWDPHDLRRAVVDRLYRAGVDVGTAAALVGHSPQVALRHYRQASEDDLLGAMRSARLGGSGGEAVIPLARTPTRTGGSGRGPGGVP